MKRTERRNLSRPTVWFVIVVGLSALVGLWNAEESREDTTSPSLPEVANKTTSLEQIEMTLAQAGCPGWMVLASEGEAALKPPAGLLPKDVKQTALHVATSVPRVRYPTPLRLANRTLFAPPAATEAFAAVGAAEDPEDLLDGVPDLLAKPAEEVGSNRSPGEEPTQQPALPEPEPPAQEPRLELPPRMPSSLLPRDLPGPTLEQPFEPPPAPPRVQPPEPVEKPPEIQAPATVEAPLQPSKLQSPEPQPPRQSPFAPPPAPASGQTAPHSSGSSNAGAASKKKTTKSRCEFIAESQFPSAQACAKCHEKIYEEWSVSSHAYAMVSPMFHKFEQTINNLSQGTSGYFCYRCHSPAGVTLGISREAPLWELPLVAREGITCVSCHRINQRFGRVNGERRLEPGDIHSPVYGSIGGSGVAEVIAPKKQV